MPELSPGSDAHGAGSPLPALERRSAARWSSRTAAARSRSPRPGSRTAAGVVWTLRDISERARLERMKSDFVATASHELRSPLTSIKGFVELLAALRGLTRASASSST